MSIIVFPGTVYLDMDGVLADFDKRVNAVPDIIEARRQVRLAAEKLGAPYSTDHAKDLSLRLRGPQDDPDVRNLKKKLNRAKELIFGFASHKGFFIGLEKMPDADELVDGVIRLTGKKPDILTAPLESSPTCVQEKLAWIQKNYGDKINEFHAEKDKFLFAGPDKILVDDTPKKIRPFNEHGGIGIYHTSAENSLKELEKVLKSHKF